MGKGFAYITYKQQFKRFPLTEENQRKLIDACNSFDEKLRVLILLDTGIRVSEFCGLEKENIDWQAGTMKVFGKRGIYGSEKPYRIIPMSERVKEMINKYLSVYGDFKKVSPRAIQKMIRKIATKTDIRQKVSPHILRHTFAVNCLKKDINLRTLQLMMGHCSIAITQIYLSLTPQDIIKEFQKKMNI